MLESDITLRVKECIDRGQQNYLNHQQGPYKYIFQELLSQDNLVWTR